MSDHYERAHFLYTNGSFAQAEKELRKHLSECVEDADAHALLAHTLLKLLRVEEAVRASTAAVNIDPESAYALHSMAAAQLKASEYEAAAQAIARSIQLDPESPSHYALAGEISLNRHRSEEALQLGMQGLSLNPEHVDSLNVTAIALTRLKRPKEADQLLDKALSIDPERYYLHANKGDVALALEDGTKAFRHFREALRINPNWKSGPYSVLQSVSHQNPILRITISAIDTTYQMVGVCTQFNYDFFKLLVPSFWISRKNEQIFSGRGPSSFSLDIVKALLFLIVGVFYFVPCIFAARFFLLLADAVFERCLQLVIKTRGRHG